MTTIIGIQHEDSCTLIADNRVTDENGRIYTHPEMEKGVCDVIEKPPNP